jgi:hypothetical protein
LTIPPAVPVILDPHPDAEVGLTLESANLIVKPLLRPRYALARLPETMQSPRQPPAKK